MYTRFFVNIINTKDTGQYKNAGRLDVKIKIVQMLFFFQVFLFMKKKNNQASTETLEISVLPLVYLGPFVFRTIMSRVPDEGQTVSECIVPFNFCTHEFSVPDEAGSWFSKEFVKAVEHTGKNQ